MKTKILCMVLALILAVVGLSACGKTDATADTTAPVAAEEDGQNPVMNFIGPYQADRCSLTIMPEGKDGAVITASWGNSADSATEWEMHASFDEDTLRLNYNDCTKKNVIYNSDGDVVEETVEYTDGVGRIQLFDDGTLRWENEEEPDTFVGMIFSFAG